MQASNSLLVHVLAQQHLVAHRDDVGVAGLATSITPAISRSLISASVPSQAPTSVFMPSSCAMRGVCSWPSVHEKVRTQRVCGRMTCRRSRICAALTCEPGCWPSR
jgi:hypothetical protein